MALMEMKAVDRRFYEQHLADFLPELMIDCHTHVWLDRHNTPLGARDPRTVTWPSRVASENPIEHLKEAYKIMFPGKEVIPLIFTNVVKVEKLDEANDYISRSARQEGYPALIMAHPSWSAELLEQRLDAGGFLGAKVYLSYAPSNLKGDEVSIFDFLTQEHLKVLDSRRAIAMLHIPRSGRLKDPVNLEQLLEIEEKYPGVSLIVAHVGRAYCVEDVGNAWEVLAKTKRMKFEFSANTNAEVFRQLIAHVGPSRILFGSDMPITRMRMRRITEGGLYINVVPRGLYGDVSNDKNMREADSPLADELTLFMYEELYAIKQAAMKTGLSREDLAAIFYHNARGLIEQAGGKKRAQS